jgi:hypothetical protein
VTDSPWNRTDALYPAGKRFLREKKILFAKTNPLEGEYSMTAVASSSGSIHYFRFEKRFFAEQVPDTNIDAL